jgi:hypothetical protein
MVEGGEDEYERKKTKGAGISDADEPASVILDSGTVTVNIPIAENTNED